MGASQLLINETHTQEKKNEERKLYVLFTHHSFL